MARIEKLEMMVAFLEWMDGRPELDLEQLELIMKCFEAGWEARDV